MTKNVIDKYENATDFKLGHGTAQISTYGYVVTDPNKPSAYLDNWCLSINIPKICYDDDYDKAKKIVKEFEAKYGKFDHVFVNTKFPRSWRGIELRKDLC